MAYPYKRLTKNKKSVVTRRKATAAAVPLATKKYINNVLYKNIETKRYTYGQATTQKAEIGVLNHTRPLHQMVKGDDVGDYLGDTLHLRGFLLHYRWHNSTIYTKYIRFLVLQDKMYFTTTNIGQDFFASRTASTNDPATFLTTGSTDQIYYALNKQRFKVLMDKKIILEPYDSSNSGKNEHTLYKYLKSQQKVIVNDNQQGNEGVSPDIRVLFFVEGENNEAPDVDPATQVDYTYHVHTYWRDA